MSKEICLIRGLKEESYEHFSKRIMDFCGNLAGKEGIRSVRAVYTAFAPPSVSIIPFRKDKIASISLTGEADRMSSGLAGEKGFAGAYLVQEAIPIAYEKTWPDGSWTPGVNLLTLFHSKPGISREQFLDRWHNSHTPLSLKIHPLWNYNRNVVLGAAAESSEAFDGIVEEHFRTRSDLMNPFRFFGPPHKVLQRMLAVYSDTNAFLDYRKIEVHLGVEIHVKS